MWCCAAALRGDEDGGGGGGGEGGSGSDRYRPWWRRGRVDCESTGKRGDIARCNSLKCCFMHNQQNKE